MAALDLGVPVRIVSSEPDQNDSCADRHLCNSPQRAGVMVKEVGTPAHLYCSTAFAVRRSGDEQVITAGHCFRGNTSSALHSGSAGLFGYLTTRTWYYQGSRADARLISTADSTTNNWIYTRATQQQTVTGKHSAAQTMVGTFVCVYAYVLQNGNCGNVTVREVDSSRADCNCTLRLQFHANYAREGGNSGGAVSSQTGATAVGIHSAATAGGAAVFSHVQHFEDESGWQIMLSP